MHAPVSIQSRHSVKDHETQMTKFAYSIDEFSELSGVGRTALYEDIGKGALRAVKRGRRTLILDEDGRAYLASLPQLQTTSQAA